jgi:hypothetical protein
MNKEQAQSVTEMCDEEFFEHVATILRRELGAAGFARFLDNYLVNTGDYTHDRYKWLGGLTLDDILKDIRSRRELPTTPPQQP